MKIVHIETYFQPQLGYQLFFLAREQQKFGHKVSIITSDRYGSFRNYDETTKPILGDRKLKKTGRFIERGIETYRLKTLFEHGNQLLMVGINGLVKKLNPDIIHVHGVIVATNWPILFNKKKCPVIFDCHATYDVFNLDRIDKKLFFWFTKRFILPKLINYGDNFIGVSEESCELMKKEYKIPNEKIDYISLGADEELFSFNDKKRKNIREKLFVKPGEILIVHVGKLVKEKEPHILIKACLPLFNKYQNLKLLIVGNGPEDYINKMKSMIKNHEKHIIWLDRVEQKILPEIYSGSDIAVWPAECSMTMIEASSTKLPIIVAEHEAIKTRVKNNNGFTFQRGDYKQLSTIIEKLIKNEKLRKEMGENGRILIEKELSWKNIAIQTINLYDKFM